MTITLTNCGLAEVFAGRLALHGVRLPLATNGQAAIFDADWKPVAVIDVGQRRHVSDRELLALLICETLNAAGGASP